jgi:galactofuranosylgalactofuranosylrhamnosyl-N-acetylglucosaminyl-diphospho-decaprenol beta-1,5/1,6-galactofuranosyltransferase
VVSTPDGTMASWYHRDKARFTEQLRKTVEIHQRLYRDWPTLAQQYRDALGEIVSEEEWARTFEASVEKPDGS